MNPGSVVAFGFVLVGLIGLLFVGFVLIRDKLLKYYIVHYENLNGDHGYCIVKACGKNDAVKKLQIRNMKYIGLLE